MSNQQNDANAEAEATAVTIQVKRITIPTYPVLQADPNPMFFEHRNIQGAKGNIYPFPFTDQISSTKVDREYDAVYLENEYIQMIMLPELGGRIFAGLDKTNGYDFFYRHKVIKPALIGLFGPWISGGVEFNWPQHHRPSTFSPTETTIEEHPDGSKTVWMGEHDPLNRTKGMVGICLYPGKAVVETKVRLFNRTPIPQTFLWWENAGVHINEQYQVIFPPDVHYSVFHTKRWVNTYPIAKGEWNNGLDYGKGTDVSWYKNSPIPSSFFAGDSKYQFFGGYDHAKEAGVVHVADRHIAFGKKFFTWGNGPFGHSWQKNLHDSQEVNSSGEYLELMAGAFTDNQPDFSWIMPYETRIFSQFWYPVQKTGAMKNANLYAAVNLEVKEGKIFTAVYATEVFDGAKVLLGSVPAYPQAVTQILFDKTVDLAPGKPFNLEMRAPAGLSETTLLLQVIDADGCELIRYQPEAPWEGTPPEPYKAPEPPAQVPSVEELYLTGLHLEQYRHVDWDPEVYWGEGLKRDPGDSRTNVAMGRMYYRRGDLAKAEAHFRTAVKRLTSLNLNPYDGEAYYNLGLTLQSLGKLEEAYDTFYKATWNHAWQSPCFYAIAQIDLARSDYEKALQHLENSLKANVENNKALNLQAAVLRRLGLIDIAEAFAGETTELDPLDFGSRFELYLSARAQGKSGRARTYLAEFKRLTRSDVQNLLDVAFDYANAGLYDEAVSVLTLAAVGRKIYPLVGYALGYFSRKLGDEQTALTWYKKGAAASPFFCFPWRLEEMLVLQDVIHTNPADARAHAYLGSLYYDKKRFAEGVAEWKQAVALDPKLAIPWRNLGLAAFNLDRDMQAALNCFKKAVAADRKDPRILLEYDSLLRRAVEKPEKRLAQLEKAAAVVAQRDDLTMELAALYNRCGKPEKALETTSTRTFHPWEGGEGTAAGQYCAAQGLLGRDLLEKGLAKEALKFFEAGLNVPDNLGEQPWEGESTPLLYYQALAYEALGDTAKTQETCQKIVGIKNDMHLIEYFKALALGKLGKQVECREKLQKLLQDAQTFSAEEPKKDFFFAGLPNPIFEDDPRIGRRIHGAFITGLAKLGLGDKAGAKAALKETLRLDPAHLAAYEEYRRL